MLPESFHREIEWDYVVVQKGAEQSEQVEPQTATLGDVVAINMGQSPPGDTVSSYHGLALLNGPTEFGAHHPTAKQYTTDARKFAQPGDLLFCVRGSTTGRMNWADQGYAIGRGVAASRHRHEPALQPLARGAIETELPELLVQAFGSISKVDFLSISWLSVPGRVMESFEDQCTRLDSRIEVREEEISSLTSSRDALRPKLISGEIRLDRGFLD